MFEHYIHQRIRKKIFPVKPRKYNTSQETSTPIFLSIKDNHRPYQFINSESYLKIRTKIVKKMKVFAQSFNLSKKTFFCLWNISIEFAQGIPSLITLSALIFRQIPR